jgi:signal transduction histidine kinase
LNLLLSRNRQLVGIPVKVMGAISFFRRMACCAGLAALVAGARLSAAELRLAEAAGLAETNAAQLRPLIAGAERTGVFVDLAGEVLWVGAARDQLVLQTEMGALRVKMDLGSESKLGPGQRVQLTGYGLAGQGFLDEALVDNDGLHSMAEQSGTIYLKTGLHALRAEWFNGRADFAFSVEYAGPHLTRQPIPDRVLFRREPGGADTNHWAQGLDYRCYQGVWEWLPHWQNAIPVAAGQVANFDLNVRTRDADVGLQFIGYLQVDEAGFYTFWTKSDDGSRLFLGNAPLSLKMLGASPLPAPREIQPGQPLNGDEDCFWATVKGTVTSLHVYPGGTAEMELTAGTNHLYLESDAADFQPPALFSRIQATGLCRSVRISGDGFVAGRLLLSSSGQIQELSPAPPATRAPVATLAQLRELAASGQRTGCPLCLTGVVLATASEQGLFAFQDETGGALIQLNHGAAPLAPGRRVVLTGDGALDGNRLYLGNAALVDNDGVHGAREKTGAIFLRAGKHPLHVSWFNRVNATALEIYWRGPDLPRQKIPNAALVHPQIDPAGGAVKWVQGLHYKAYEGDWQNVPKISRLDPVKIGGVAGFDLRAASRNEKAGLEFSGFLDVPRDGQYFFYVTSDDGSFLFLDEQSPRVDVIGTNALPVPFPIAPRQIMRPDQNNRWSEAEGTVTFAYERGDALFLELSSVYGAMHVEVADGTGGSPLLLLGSQVKIQGFCQSALVADGRGMAANLITPGMAQVHLLKNLPAQWERYPLQPIGEVRAKLAPETDEVIARVRGAARVSPGDRRLTLTDATGSIEVETVQALPADLTGEVEAIGRLIRSETNTALRCSIYRKPAGKPEEAAQKLPLLTTIQQVKQLEREQAQRGYPVKIRGVITLVRGSGSGFILQDDTSAIDVWWQPYANTSLPRLGDYWEIEGETFAEFSPNIRARRAVRLGVGTMPEPVHPAWDQLLNGSLDTRYVELQGIVTAADADGVALLTRAGKIRVLLSPEPPETWRHYQDALVRIRGCVVPVRDASSQQVQVGQLRLSSVSLTVDEPAPSDPFATAPKHVSDLLLFDARAGSLQRVKVAGQILHTQGGTIFLADGTNAVRVLPQNVADFKAGDLLEAVGFPELGHASPVLREAVLRRTGHAPLPAPVRVADDTLFSKGHDGQLISVEARLVGVSGNGGQKILELQNGSREFVARVEDREAALANLVAGSRLRLAGVYVEQGGGVSATQPATSFELLLNAAADVSVLERPPWWTLQRVFMFAGGMAVIILVAIFWIVSLRRQVEERSAQLAAEVRHREQVQQQNLLEKERSRIAKDMHDQLGASVTRVGLLAELTKKNAADKNKTAAHVEKIRETALELGRTLDEIVWAVNPKNDSLDKFCDYLAVQAQELFQLTNTLCRVDLPPEMPGYPLSAEVRHNLFLATKEALNNVVRHAEAKEVWVRFKWTAARFQIVIVDDGKGFVPEQKPSLRNGLQNMQKRLEDCGGNFTIASRPGRGTEVTLSINLNPPPKESA